VYPSAWYYLSARNMAIAEGLGLELFPLCNGCYMSFVETKHHLEVNPRTRGSINEDLKKEGLTYTGNVRIVHILEILHDIIGVDTIGANVIRPIKGLKFATHPWRSPREGPPSSSRGRSSSPSRSSGSTAS
jgi:heterodisulfide reductase subunit B